MMILKEYLLTQLRKKGESLAKMTYYGRKLISFSLKSSYCFARFRLLVWLESIACKKIPLMRFLIYQKIRLLFLDG
jgi:hypothetical protein